MSLKLQVNWCRGCIEWNPNVNEVKNFNYTGGEQGIVAKKAGYYKLEAWGAQGGMSDPVTSRIGVDRSGYGGYSVGVIQTQENNKLYINVGGQGCNCVTSGCESAGGYNGGGNGGNCASSATCKGCGSGGGATHIANVSGLLSALELYKGTLINETYYNSKKILIVAGGGGGSFYVTGGASWSYIGGNGGGYIGVDGSGPFSVYGGTQVVGGTIGFSDGSFGKGGDRTAGCYSGGGGGWYGGAAGYNGTQWSGTGGGGSGYIGSSNLISGGGITKHMTCYSCTTSTVDAMRTNSNTTTPSAIATADVAKLGNGYAKITYLGASI